MDDSALLTLAADLARRAGDAILAIRERGFETLRKHDASPVTEADHAAEALIVAGLRAATPGIPVIAEEEVAAGVRHDIGREYWLVDPLDGTREFAALRDEFTVNIGLVRDGRAVLGAVDLGYRVVVPTDAICSSSDATHDALLTLYRERYGGQVETASTDEILASWA